MILFKASKLKRKHAFKTVALFKALKVFWSKNRVAVWKTRVTGIFSEQKSETQTIAVEGEATVSDFKMYAMDYDDNRHFFLAHYFRDNYDNTVSQYPFLSTNIEITRIEVWVTNRSNRTENIRSVVGIQDIGESDIKISDYKIHRPILFSPRPMPRQTIKQQIQSIWNRRKCT